MLRAASRGAALSCLHGCFLLFIPFTPVYSPSPIYSFRPQFTLASPWPLLDPSLLFSAIVFLFLLFCFFPSLRSASSPAHSIAPLRSPLHLCFTFQLPHPSPLFLVSLNYLSSPPFNFSLLPLQFPTPPIVPSRILFSFSFPFSLSSFPSSLSSFSCLYSFISSQCNITPLSPSICSFSIHFFPSPFPPPFYYSSRSLHHYFICSFPYIPCSSPPPPLFLLTLLSFPFLYLFSLPGSFPPL